MNSLLIPLPFPSGTAVPELPLAFEVGHVLVLGLLAFFALVSAALVASAISGQLRALAAPQVVTCPRTATAAIVRLDPLRSTIALLKGGTAMKIRECALWPRFSDCGQECVRQPAGG